MILKRNPLAPISISLSPNTEADDVRLAGKVLFQPRKWKIGGSIRILEDAFAEYIGVKHAVSFNSGRSALLAILDSLNLKKGTEVLLQAFTCNAAVNPVLWAGFKPIYVDCDLETFNIDIEDLERKITRRSRILIVQHTFGLANNMENILEICKRENLFLIEDCAHALGAEYDLSQSAETVGDISHAGWAKAGSFGTAAFFSFSRDKIISSVYGGMAVTSDEELGKRIRQYQWKMGYPSYFWIFQQLLHPLLMNWLILPTYRYFGKYLLVLLQQAKILSKAVHAREKRGEKPAYFPKALPNALAVLAVNQLGKIEKLNLYRRKMAFFYYKELEELPFMLPANPAKAKHVFLRFTIKTDAAHKIIKKAWKQNILLGDWYTNPVAPADTNLEKVGYVLGSCPVAERLAGQTLNLPTHIRLTEEDGKRIVDFLKTFPK